MAGIDLKQSGDPVQTVAAEARTVADILRLRARLTPSSPANFSKIEGRWQETSWREFYDQARMAAGGLVDLGLEVGDCVAILGPTHAEWGIYDFGAHLAGLVTVGVYPLQSVEQVRYLLEHSEARAIFVAEEGELRTVLEAAAGNEHLRAIIPWSVDFAAEVAGEDERVVSPVRFADRPITEESITERQQEIDSQDTAILIYTSGTTGPPKGAMISQANLLSLLRSQAGIVSFRRDDLVLSFLPMAHATERVLGFYIRVDAGIAAAYATSIGAVLGEVREVAPTIFGSVPRLFEKAYSKIASEIARQSWVVRKLFAWASAVGHRRLRFILAGEEVPPGLQFRYRVAERLVFRKVQSAFGGRVRFCLTGAAPISRQILEFFWAAGIPIYEAYGMTEATVVTHINRQNAVELGTVGQVVPPQQCRIADDGEILLKGPFVFKGYYKNEAATRETIVDGWLHTGDIGKLDDRGFLTITDRKKHLIITAGGKNVAPANIERAIKTKSPMISQVHAHGDRRKYVAALIAPSPLETLDWGAERGLVSEEELLERRTELARDPAARSAALEESMSKVATAPEFQKLFLAPVREGNAELARVERVRRFFVLGRDFSQEAGEMTPTMKMKRKVIEEKYAEVFDRLYEDQDFAIDAEEI